jgi:hypothetical protein
VPRWGTPKNHPPQSPHRPQRQHHNTPVQRQLFFLMGDNQTIPIQGQDLKQTGGSGTGPERALERRHPDPPRATARKLSRPQRSLRVQDRSRGAPVEAPIPQRQHRHSATAKQVRAPGVCSVLSERSGCTPYPGFHPGLVCSAPLGHSEEPSFPELTCEHRTGPAEPPKTAAERDRPKRALEAIKPFPSRAARKPILPRAYLRASDRSRGARLLFLLASPQPSR